MDKPTAPAEPEAQGERVTHETARLIVLDCCQGSRAGQSQLRAYIDQEERLDGVAEQYAQQAESELAELRRKLEKAKLDHANACDVGRRLEAKLQAAEAELAHTREAAGLLRNVSVAEFYGGAGTEKRFKSWFKRDQKRATAATEDTRLAEALAHPPGPRHAQLVTPLDAQPLTRADVHAIVAELAREAFVNVDGPATYALRLLAEAAESKRRG